MSKINNKNDSAYADMPADLWFACSNLVKSKQNPELERIVMKALTSHTTSELEHKYGNDDNDRV